MSYSKDIVFRGLNLRTRHYEILKMKDHSMSYHIEQALDLYFSFCFSVYKITEVDTGKFYIDFYDYNREAQDVFWHCVHTRGNGSLGHWIRERGTGYFEFEVLVRCDKIKEAERLVKIYTKLYHKKGFENWEF